MHKFSPYLATCLLGAALATLPGCASLSGNEPNTPEPKEVQIQPSAGANSEEAQYAEFEPEVLYQLLTAEIAGQRGRYDVTLANYLQAARTSRDTGVIARAARIAQSLGADSAQQELADLWLEVAPQSVDAHRLAAIQALKQNDMKAALSHMENLMDQGEDANFDSLAAMSASLPYEEQQEMLSLYQQLAERHPDTPELDYSIALLQKITGSPEQALESLNQLLDRHRNFQPAIILKADLLYQVGRKREALNYLTTNTRRFPASQPMGTLYGRMLLNEDQLQAAQDEFQRLVDRYPNNPDLRLSLGLVALENNEPDVAREELTRLIEQDHYADQASYYLGRIEEEAGNTEQAINYYQSVEQGNFFFPSLARASSLQAQNGNLEEARSHIRSLRDRHPDFAERFWLVEVNLLLEHGSPSQALEAANMALQEYPDNVDIRYSRAMLLDTEGNTDKAVQDLTRVLELEPDNAAALNALGYILTVRTDRLEEARQYIERALSLDPENPAILDSMGWVLYRQGDYQGALDYLAQAWAAFPDPEVAAHYGEVLWVTGNQDQARIVWDEALDENPDHDILLETINRLTSAGGEE
jgi:tetratricopeptide (TPR) repeat protein